MPPRVAIAERLLQKHDMLGNNNARAVVPVIRIPPEDEVRIVNPAQDEPRFENRIRRELRLCSLLEETRGIIVKVTKNDDGTLNLYRWVCAIPGPPSSPFEGGLYKLYVEFPAQYPFRRPKFRFRPGFFHPNVDRNGRIHGTQLTSRRYNVMNKMWKILMEVENLLDFQDRDKVMNLEARRLSIRDRPAYWRRVQEQAQQYDPIRIRQEILAEI